MPLTMQTMLQHLINYVNQKRRPMGPGYQKRGYEVTILPWVLFYINLVFRLETACA